MLDVTTMALLCQPCPHVTTRTLSQCHALHCWCPQTVGTSLCTEPAPHSLGGGEGDTTLPPLPTTLGGVRPPPPPSRGPIALQQRGEGGGGGGGGTGGPEKGGGASVCI